MKISELYTRACFRFYRDEEQSGVYDLYAISRIFNHKEQDWDILLLDSTMEGVKVFNNIESLYEEYFKTKNYKSVLEVPFTEYNKEMMRNVKREGTWEYEEILPVVKVSEVKRVAYKTSDGETFLTEEEAMQYEAALVATRYFRLHYSPDLNETGRMEKTAILKVVEPSRINTIKLAESWCLNNIGPKKAYIQGVTETGNWGFSEIKKENVGKNERVHNIN